MTPTFADRRRILLDAGGRGVEQTFDVDTTTDLPGPAQRLLRSALPHGTTLSSAVDLEMCGRIKLGIWLPFTAREVLVAGVGFVWAADVGPRVLRFVGADELGPDGARMHFRLYGRLPVVDDSGVDVERSAAGRLAAETVAWLPHALTPQAGAEWRAIDDRRAVVTLPGPAGPVDVEVCVDERGNVVRMQLERWNAGSAPPALEPFGGSVTSRFDTGHVGVAGRGTVGWGRGTSDEADAVFFDYRVTSARFPSLGSGS